MADKSAKGQKIGRNSRAPTNKMQKSRTERNKRLNAERAHKLGMKQPHSGQKSEDMYRGFQPAVNKAAKFLAGCMAVWDAKHARIMSQH